jgi:uncharacterized protein
MSTQHLLIDNIAFAKRNERLTGELSVADCPRLSDLLRTQAPPGVDFAAVKFPSGIDNIKFSMVGEADVLGRNFLHLELRSALTTYCQRCLEQMPLQLNLSFHYLIGDADINNLDVDATEDVDDFDLQEASQSMDVAELVEDEIIMALPIAPTHTHDCAKVIMQSGEKPNPFAVLKGLIKS